MDNQFSLISPEFRQQVADFKKVWTEHYQEIGREETPKYDGAGKQVIKPKGNTGYDYIDETWMRAKLDEHFPGWSMTMASPLHFLGAEWVVAQIELQIIDFSLIPLGITPPVRKFYGVDSVRIQFKKDSEHKPENIIDVGDNCKQAVTSALKYAINRLTRIGDDVYGKRTEMEGAGDIETVIEMSGSMNMFTKWITSHKISFTELFKILDIHSLDEITSVNEAMNKVKAAKNIK
jgi:hypothetical protein